MSTGCASAPPKAAPTTPAAGSESAAADAAACDHFADQLCEKLGPDTEPCVSMRNVREWLPAKACVVANGDMDGVLAHVAELRKACDTLTEKLCAELGADSGGCNDVKHDIPRVPAGHCAVLLSHYPELVVQIKEHQERDKPLDDATWHELLAGAPPAFGPDASKVTIVEFSDFQCPYCAQAADTVKQIHDKYGDKVHLVFRQFPLSFHEHARAAAHAALSAHAQGKFWQLHDLMFAHQGALDQKSLEGYAAQSGLDVAKFKKSMDDDGVDKQVEADIALGRKVHVEGTPSMFINGKRIENPTDFAEVQPAIDAALAK
ncbi:MAG TPA: thioredoxin domain-containing protein [Polyangiales bacterium]